MLLEITFQQKYYGKWWENARTPVSFSDDNDKCGGAEYGPVDARTITVNNSHIISYSDASGSGLELQSILGNAKILDPDFPNKLLVYFDYGYQMSGTRDERANYWVRKKLNFFENFENLLRF